MRRAKSLQDNLNLFGANGVGASGGTNAFWLERPLQSEIPTCSEPTLIARVEEHVRKCFYQELSALEMRWTHNPYMQLFDAGDQPRARDTAYRDMLQQIAYDFRRFFFESWARDLRQQRPYMNDVQRDLLQRMLVERFGQIEQDFTAQLNSVRRDNAALRAELAELRRNGAQRSTSPRDSSPLLSASNCALLDDLEIDNDAFDAEDFFSIETTGTVDSADAVVNVDDNEVPPLPNTPKMPSPLRNSLSVNEVDPTNQ